MNKVEFLKFFLAIVLSGSIGLEREYQGRAAGLRTHIMVCLGSVLAIVVSQYFGGRTGPLSQNIIFDQARIAAGVLTGIGFLGAGAIITIGNTRRGLTTASTVWFVAALGIAIGLGLYATACCATIFALIVVVGLRYVSQIMHSHETLSLEVHLDGDVQQIEDVEKSLAKAGYRVTSSRLQAFRTEKRVIATFEITAGNQLELENVTSLLQTQFPSITTIIFERLRIHE